MEHMGSTLAVLTPVAAGLVWIGSGVWRIAKWTERHDSRVGSLEVWKVATDTKLAALDADATALKVDMAALKAKVEE